MISGYMAADKPFKSEKLINMWFQVFFYSFVLMLIFVATGLYQDWSIKGMIKSALPVTFGKFWYFTVFFCAFFAMPVLNKFLFSIDERTARKVFLILIMLFSVLGILYDPFKTNGGYSALWLMVLYCVGVLAKRGRIFEKKKSIILILFWAGCIGLTWFVKVYIGIGRLTNYCSPTILASGLIMVILFSRIKLKGSIISKLSPLAFGIYLFQNNQVIWTNYIKNAVAFVVEKNIFIGVLIVFAFAALIFLSGLIVEFIRSKLMQLIRLPILSKKLAVLFDRILERCVPLLK